MMVLKRDIFLKKNILSIILGTGAFFSLIAWVTNIIDGYPQWGILKIEPLINWCQQLRHYIPFRWFASMHLVVVDLSTVTTGVVMATLASAAWRVFKVIPNKIPKDTEHFPFWPTYKIVFVQLGLLGTLWGFIIAFRQTALTAADAPQILLSALGTALWSTFSAVLLAFVLCPLIFEQLLFDYLFKDKTRSRALGDTQGQGLVKEEVREITQSFSDLWKQVDTTVKSLHKFGEEVNALNFIQDILSQISTMRADLGRLRNDWEQQVKDTNSKLAAIESDVAHVKPQVKHFVAKIEQIDQTLSKVVDTGNKLSTVEKELAIVKTQVKSSNVRIEQVDLALNSKVEVVSNNLAAIGKEIKDVKTQLEEISKTKWLLSKVKSLLEE